MKPTPQAIAAVILALGGNGAALDAYNFGNPTAEEQLHLEFINRARANPPAEGLRLATTTDPEIVSSCNAYNVDLAMLQSEFNAIAPAPPLAPNAALTAAARSHSQWMFVNQVQSHDETNPPNTPWSRMLAAGYTYSTAGENIFAYAKSTWHGHAGFEIDWGGPIGGMQYPRGHRNAIHNPNFREVGIGVVLGTNGSVGPQLVTQDFGSRSSSPNFGTGVAYYDLNGNAFYDPGEGIAGLTVNLTGASYQCHTAIGGGWALPVPATAATRTLAFSGLNVNHSVPLTFAANQNAKADLILTYSPPGITSPATAAANSPHTLTFSPVGGATAYSWSRSTLTPAASENCESTAAINSSTSASYQILNANIVQQGSGSFHLLNATGDSQWIELLPVFHGGTHPALSFQSRLRYSTSDERFKVQIREEGSTTWTDADSQTGYNGSGEATFSLRQVALSALSGKSFRIRFLLDFSGGSYYPATGDNLGWFIDAIQFNDLSTLTAPVTETLTTTSASFTPTQGTYLMMLSPVISNRNFPASYQILTASQPSFAAWAANLETLHALPPGTLSTPDADPDADDRANLIEYAFNTSPINPADPRGSLPTLTTTATHLVLSYQCRANPGNTTLTPEASTDLQSWTPPGSPDGFTDVLIHSDGTTEFRQASIPLHTATRTFLRLKATLGGP